jgi:hypothetical protein
MVMKMTSFPQPFMGERLRAVEIQVIVVVVIINRPLVLMELLQKHRQAILKVHQ